MTWYILPSDAPESAYVGASQTPATARRSLAGDLVLVSYRGAVPGLPDGAVLVPDAGALVQTAQWDGVRAMAELAVSGTIAALTAELATGQHDDYLDVVRDAEVAGKNRIGALSAIDARIAAV
jgi:hypothetical protein